MKQTLWWLLVVAALATVGCAQGTARSSLTSHEIQAAPEGTLAETRPLFVIERSKNANVVHYDARLTADGNLDPREPVIAYYVMLAEDGRRKELNWIERTMAYGFDIKQDASARGYEMTIVGAPQRSITVRREGHAVRAEMVIDGQQAFVEKMYINVSEALPWPKVEFIDLYGKDVRTGERRFEEIVPK